LREAFDEGFDRPDLFAEDEDLNSLRGDPRFHDLLDDVMNSGSAQASRRAAAREFERLTKRSHVDEGDWNSVGLDLLRSGDYERAADAFDREFKVSQDEDAIYNRACARSLAGKEDEALKLLEQAITAGTVDADHMADDPDLVALHDQKRFDELVSLAEDLSLHFGNWWKHAGVWSWKGDDEKAWRKAIPHFEDVTREHPKIGRAWFNLGYAQLAADEPKNSAASFQRALDLGYQPATTMYNLACSAAQSGDVDAAIVWLERAEEAGMKLWRHAHGDDDLDPLRSDSRFKKMAKRWKSEEMAEHEHDKDWD
jgi:tetratricopeptide (TPR) repeat protein